MKHRVIELIALLMVLSSISVSQTLDWAREFLSRFQQESDHFVMDAFVDRSYNLHALVSIRPPIPVGEQILKYVKVDKTGRTHFETKILGGEDRPSVARMTLDGERGVCVVFTHWYRNDYVYIDTTGAIIARHENISSDAPFEFCVDATDAVVLIIDGSQQFVYKVGRNGSLNLASKRSWKPPILPNQPAFIKENSILLAGRVRWRDPSRFPVIVERYVDSLDFATIDTAFAPLQNATRISLPEYADAVVQGVQLRYPEVVTTSSGAFVFASGAEERGQHTYRIRFDSSGQPLKPSSMGTMHPVGLSDFWQSGSFLRLSYLVDYNKGEPKSAAFLYGFTSQGEMYYEKLGITMKMPRH
jgi:hypothetical protein